MSRRNDKSTEGSARIIMVDDEADFITIVREWLAPRYDFVGLHNGGELLDTLEEFEPDLIILDVQMPGPDGFTLCDKLQSTLGYAAIPILFLTALKGDLDFTKGLKVGCSFYLTKPTTRSELISTINMILLGNAKTIGRRLSRG